MLNIIWAGGGGCGGGTRAYMNWLAPSIASSIFKNLVHGSIVRDFKSTEIGHT